MCGAREDFKRRGGFLANGLLVLCLVVGCGYSPKPASPEAARKALQTALEGWKKGQTQESFVEQSSIQTVDSRWSNGCRLMRYEIDAGEERHGYDLNYQVTLQIQDRNGRTFQEKACYSIATAPKVVVIRKEDF